MKLNNMKKNIVFIPNIDCNDNRNSPYHYSVQSWINWSKQFDDIEVIVWTDPIVDPKHMKITLQRYWVFDILKHNNIQYDQVLMVDADTIVHPNCPNFFLETEHKFCGVLNNGCYEWVTRSIRDWGNHLFPNEEKIKPWKYINGGFIIANSIHEPFFNDVKTYYTDNLKKITELTSIIKAGTDQTIVNYLLNIHKVDVKLLPECYDLQEMFNKHLLHIPGNSWWPDELLFTEAGWVYHFNAIPNNPRDLYYWMQRTYNELWNQK